METLYTLTRLFLQFFGSFKIKTKQETEDLRNYKYIYPRLGINLKADAKDKKAKNSLLSQLYSEDNNTLFI